MKYELMGKPFLFLFAVVLITLLSTCSLLYPLNPWDDANVYMTIGNAMLGGKELYVDIFDHKGPVLFFLHEWAAMLSRSSFVGIYLLEVVCCYFYLLYSLRTMRLFAPSSVAVPLMCLLGVLTYSSDFFSYGDSVEEFALPIFAHSLYHMLRFVMDRQIPPRWHSFAMGFCVALLFWMKFNLLFFYAGGLLVLLFIAWRRSQTKEFWTIIWWAFLGFLAVTAGVLIYFAVHGTLGALWYAYFEVNIFHYHGVGTNGEPPFWWFKLVKLGIWAVLMIPVFFLRVSKEVKWLVFGTYGLLVLSYATLTVQFYYFLTLFGTVRTDQSLHAVRITRLGIVIHINQGRHKTLLVHILHHPVEVFHIVVGTFGDHTGLFDQLLQFGIVVDTGRLTAAVHTHREEDGFIIPLGGSVHQTNKHHTVYQPAGLPVVEHVQARIADATQQVSRLVRVEQIAATGHIHVRQRVQMVPCPRHGSIAFEDE